MSLLLQPPTTATATVASAYVLLLSLSRNQSRVSYNSTNHAVVESEDVQKVSYHTKLRISISSDCYFENKRSLDPDVLLACSSGFANTCKPLGWKISLRYPKEEIMRENSY